MSRRPRNTATTSRPAVAVCTARASRSQRGSLAGGEGGDDDLVEGEAKAKHARRGGRWRGGRRTWWKVGKPSPPGRSTPHQVRRGRGSGRGRRRRRRRCRRSLTDHIVQTENGMSTTPKVERRRDALVTMPGSAIGRISSRSTCRGRRSASARAAAASVPRTMAMAVASSPTRTESDSVRQMSSRSEATASH